MIAACLSHDNVARLLGEKMRAAIKSPFELDGQAIRVGVTIGFALAPGMEMTWMSCCTRLTLRRITAKEPAQTR